ncbi:hypothetical protein ACGF13_28450 [Kitasatospora sp. NPDC048286]|uniref:hypothetical protein n=1 Tax=Kitasatospora sp. NPDC048286 TaxID=3364047 RepID=UPI0037190BFA
MAETKPPEQVEPAPWRDRRFQVFAAGNFANNLGEAAYKVGLPLYVYDLTGSLATMFLMAALAPAMLLISPWLGAVVDRCESVVPPSAAARPRDRDATSGRSGGRCRRSGTPRCSYSPAA